MANYISAIKLPNGDIYQLKDKNALPLIGGTVTGPTSFNDSVDIDDLNVGTLLVNGNATLVNGVQIGGNTQVDKINGVTVGDSPKFTDTTYTFDGTYNASSNKAATVQTVTNAINNLDVTAKTGAASQTITSISQTNGKIDVTYSNISITKSQVSDFPTSWDLSNISGADDLKAIEALTGATGFLKKTNTNTWSLDTNTYLTATTLPAASTSTAGITKVGASGGAAAYDHVHGHLTNAGAITTTATIASGDKLVIVDSNDSSKINGSSITFGSDQTKFLTNKGTWVVPTGTYSLPTATSSTLGGIKIGYTENGKNYPVELSNGQAYVNVPWTDNNTTYSAGTGLSLSGTTFNHSNSIAAGTAGTSTATSSTDRQIAIPYVTYDAQGHITASGTHTHTIESFPEAYLTWGGKSFSNSYGPIDAAMVPELGANRFAFLKPEGIEIEYSRDNGSTWKDYGLSNLNKQAFFTEIGTAVLQIGKADANNLATSDYLLRIIITTNLASIYTTLNKIFLSVGTNGNTGCYVKIEKALKSDEDNYILVNSHGADSQGRVPLSGWPGYNIINFPGFTTYGNSPSWQYSKIRLTFGCTGGTGASNGGNRGGFSIYKCYAFGGVGWTTPSTLAKYGRIYSYDINQNVTFPAKVTATEFVGNIAWSKITSTPTTLSGYGITDSILKWQTSTTAATNIYDFGVYVAQGTGGATGPINQNYYTMLNIPYRKAFGNTKADYGWSIAGSTSNDKRLFYRTSDGNTWGDWVEIAHINAGTAVGHATQPVYVNSIGVVTACTSYANASVNHATSADSATKATQDSDGNQINTTYLKLAGGTMTGTIYGNASTELGSVTKPFHALFLGGTTNATMTAASTNPRITFCEGVGIQPVHILYCDYDNYRNPAGLKIVGDSNNSSSPAWLQVEGTVYAAGFNGNASTATEFSSNATVTLTGDTTGTSAGSKKSWDITTTTNQLSFKNGRIASADLDISTIHSKMVLTLASSSMTTQKPPMGDGYIVTYGWDNAFWGAQQAISHTKTPHMAIRGTNGGSSNDWGNWIYLLDANNYTDYTVKKDGTGATGSWGISITGTAATATGDKNGNDITTTYLPLTGGTLSGKLTVGTTSQSAAPTAAIHVHDIRNYTIPTTMFNTGVNWFFTAKGTPTGKYWSGMHINGWTGDYNAWELVGPSHNEDQRTTPLYVRTGRTTNGWGSWGQLYDSRDPNALINDLSTGSSTMTHDVYMITQYEDGTKNTYHRRKVSDIRVGGLLTARKLKVALNSETDVTFNGTADVTNIPISGTLGVAHGGTGASSFTSGALLIGNGTSAVGTKSIATSIAANSTSTDIPTSSAVAALVASNKQGTLTFALDTNDTKKLIITYSH